MMTGNEEGLLTISEAALLLRISVPTLRRYADSGEITCYRLFGGHRRFRAEEINAYIEKCRINNSGE